MWLCLWSFSAGCVTCSRCSCDAPISHAGKYLHYVPLVTAPGDLEIGIPCSQGSSLVPNECVTTRLSVRLDSWDLGSGMPSVRDCHTSRSLLVILTNFESLFNYRMPKTHFGFKITFCFIYFETQNTPRPLKWNVSFQEKCNTSFNLKWLFLSHPEEPVNQKIGYSLTSTCSPSPKPDGPFIISSEKTHRGSLSHAFSPHSCLRSQLILWSHHRSLFAFDLCHSIEPSFNYLFSWCFLSLTLGLQEEVT